MNPARALLSRHVGRDSSSFAEVPDRVRRGDAELLGHILGSIEQAEHKAGSAHDRARFGGNADLQADEAQKQDELAERHRDVAKQMFGVAFPGIDPARFVKAVFP